MPESAGNEPEVKDTEVKDTEIGSSNVPKARLAVSLDGTETLENVWSALEMIQGVDTGAVNSADLGIAYLFLGADADVTRVSRAAAMVRGVRLVYGAAGGRLQTFVIACDGRSITCLVCGMTSHNIDDVTHRYCGCCHKFHSELFHP